MSGNSFGTRSELVVGDRSYEIHQLDRLDVDLARLPYALKVLLENVVRNEGGAVVTADDVEGFLAWDPDTQTQRETLFTPARVLLQDFTGVPTLVDLTAMREALADLGGDPAHVSPSLPADLVIDHSLIAEVAGFAGAARRNEEIEFERNKERYRFLRWGAQSFDGLRVLPPGSGIVHQVHVEHLARVVFDDGQGRAYPDTMVGLDSHTTMVNGLGVLGWGVGGIEAEAAMLGQPISMLLPPVIGLKLSGSLPEGTTATDLVLTITELLRSHGVVGKIVEFFGEGVTEVPVENRATIGNMSPEYGSTASIFPVDEETLRYLRFTGRSEEHVALVEAYTKQQQLFHDPTQQASYSSVVELDLGTVVPSLAGPSRPQDRVALTDAKPAYNTAAERFRSIDAPGRVEVTTDDGTTFELKDGDIVVAGITRCTNTSNPQVMMGAGLLARNAVERGLTVKPWVKTSLAPGSRVVMDYYNDAGLLPYLEKLGFYLVGFGCTTCSGNSGPLAPEISGAIQDANLVAVSILSGNRNFEGRIHPDVKMNYLASPPLVVAYALAGTMNIDVYNEPLGHDPAGEPVYLRDIWPTEEDIASTVRESVQSQMFTERYADIETGDDLWEGLETPSAEDSPWEEGSTYIKKAPFWQEMPREPNPLRDIVGARVLALLGDSVTTDHISPGGNIPVGTPAGRWLQEHGVEPIDFNQYGTRRGNHEVMMRGGFANIRLRNQLVPGVEGGMTLKLPEAEQTSIFDAAMRYQDENVPVVVVAGKEYGTGSSRDWAAKAPRLLGVKAILAESFERIHRSNLIGMGILPLQFQQGDSAETLGLTGHEVITIRGLEGADEVPDSVVVEADAITFTADVRIDTGLEADYYRHGGILDYVVRQLREKSN